jgi:hypothetical protein
MLTVGHEGLYELIDLLWFLALPPPLTEDDVTADPTLPLNEAPSALRQLCLPPGMLLLHPLLPRLLLLLLYLLLLLLLLLWAGVLASHQADLLGMLEVVTVALEQPAVHRHLHPHHLIHQPTHRQERKAKAKLDWFLTWQ